jgi:hypothetical protein
MDICAYRVRGAARFAFLRVRARRRAGRRPRCGERVRSNAEVGRHRRTDVRRRRACANAREDGAGRAGERAWERERRERRSWRRGVCTCVPRRACGAAVVEEGLELERRERDTCGHLHAEGAWATKEGRERGPRARARARKLAAGCRRAEWADREREVERRLAGAVERGCDEGAEVVECKRRHRVRVWTERDSGGQAGGRGR